MLLGGPELQQLRCLDIFCLTSQNGYWSSGLPHAYANVNTHSKISKNVQLMLKLSNYDYDY